MARILLNFIYLPLGTVNINGCFYGKTMTSKWCHHLKFWYFCHVVDYSILRYICFIIYTYTTYIIHVYIQQICRYRSIFLSYIYNVYYKRKIMSEKFEKFLLISHNLVEIEHSGYIYIFMSIHSAYAYEVLTSCLVQGLSSCVP